MSRFTFKTVKMNWSKNILNRHFVPIGIFQTSVYVKIQTFWIRLYNVNDEQKSGVKKTLLKETNISTPWMCALLMVQIMHPVKIFILLSSIHTYYITNHYPLVSMQNTRKNKIWGVTRDLAFESSKDSINCNRNQCGKKRRYSIRISKYDTS